MTKFQQYAASVYSRCDELALYSQQEDCIDRRYLTKQHKSANEQVATWMQQAGMNTWQDEAGNQWGGYKSETPEAKTLVFGSHLDTVPNSGKYDGILGVLLPISFIHYCSDHNIQLPFNLEVVGFADEEGSRFGTTLLGSRAVAGSWLDKWASLKDSADICLAQAMRDFGLDINKVGNAARSKEELLAFVEVHIEQGPVLESKGLSVGVVSAIAGARRFEISVKGNAGHAGTVPMEMRQDALNAAAEMILQIENIALESGIVATVGKIENAPNAVNVISGNCLFSLDIRSQSDQARDNAIESIHQSIESIAIRRKVTTDIVQTHSANAVKCDEQLCNELLQATKQCSLEPLLLPSGAGHDAMALTNVCPIAMLFTRCEKGISHHPDESITISDIETTLNVMDRFIQIRATKTKSIDSL